MNSLAPLKITNPIEANQDWNLIMRELPILATWISKTFAVDLSGLEDKNNIIVQGSEPEGDDATKLWINSVGAPFIGVPSQDGYKKIYPYPAYTPLLWVGSEDLLPSYMRKLSEAEVDSMGFTLPDGSEYFYVILEP